MRGGSKPGERRGGRKKGSLNKQTLVIRQQVEATGLTPLDVMLDNMRHAYDQAKELESAIGPEMLKGVEDNPQKAFERLLSEVKRSVGYRAVAADAAKDAAPYCHPRLASTEVTGKDGGALIVQVFKFADDTNTPQVAAPSVSKEGMGLSGKGRQTRLLGVASPIREG